MLTQLLKKNAPGFWPQGIFLFVLFIVVDQFSKHLADKIFKNSSFAFSLPVPTPLIYVIYILVVAGIIYYVLKNYRNFSTKSCVAWTLIFAGAASNIGERIFLGFVRDFIYITFYKWTGVYNLADGYIIAGIILLLLGSTKVIDKNQTNDMI
jgi:lipoprotein signal peptidase